MQKSIFKRYLSITMIIVILSFTMLGSMMMLFFSQYWRNEKKELLTQNASSIAGLAEGYLVQEEKNQYRLPAEVLQGFISSFSTSIDADIFITDLKGNILAGNYPNSKLQSPVQVPEQAVALAAKGMYEGKNNLDGFYKSSYYIIGVPMYARTDNTCVGAVFAAASVVTVNSFRDEWFRIFLVAAAVALAVAFCVIGMFAYRLVKPLRQMSAAARSFGAGDFSVRVPVTSEDELGQLAVSFNNMANSLSISEGTRRSFIANVSHELKTPMTTIAGFIDGILDGTISREEQEKYLQVVSSEVKRLSRLVRSMLDLSRIDNGEMKLKPVSFNITRILVDTLLTFEQRIDEKQIEVRGLENARAQTVYGDQDLIHQVVYNLIENAVKFTEQGGYIAVQITDGIDRTSVVIENSGQGIAAEELPRIFERFYKTDRSRSQDKNGMGLGLYIVKTILKLHSGDIGVSSVAGQNCRFEFYLPKPPEPPKLKEGLPLKLKELKPRETKGKEGRQKEQKEHGKTGK